ncbi:MAG: response regulator transcription factor [Actinobacteria bacterium]|nr:response regulator transcription factor [Actinomycetota bacterium]
MVLDAEPDITVIGEASDGFGAVRAVGELAPDVVLMDVRMPRLDGIAATAQIVQAHPDARIIVLTTFDLDEYAFGALRAGASGFLLKDAHPQELTAAIRAVHVGDATLSPRVTRRMLELFADRVPRAEQEPVIADTAVAELTERETEVFRAIAEGLSNAEIAATLFLSESTVKTHVGRVLTKLGARDRVHLVILAYQLGIATNGPRPPADGKARSVSWTR